MVAGCSAGLGDDRQSHKRIVSHPKPVRAVRSPLPEPIHQVPSAAPSAGRLTRLCGALPRPNWRCKTPSAAMNLTFDTPSASADAAMSTMAFTSLLSRSSGSVHDIFLRCAVLRGAEGEHFGPGVLDGARRGSKSGHRGGHGPRSSWQRRCRVGPGEDGTEGARQRGLHRAQHDAAAGELLRRAGRCSDSDHGRGRSFLRAGVAVRRPRIWRDQVNTECSWSIGRPRPKVADIQIADADIGPSLSET